MPRRKEETKTNEKDQIPLVDKVYEYNEKAIQKQHKERPWKKTHNYFKSVKINVLAATKMVKHAVQGVHAGRKKSGMPIEVMGLLVGRPDGDTLIVMDCVELPVEGTEARVVADDEKVLGFMTRMQDRIETLRKDRFIGWYHSHPFDVGAHSNAFFSAIDVNTQLNWQLTFGKWVGIVVDPLRCLATQKIELCAFMAYPPTYENPPKDRGPDGTNGTKEKLTDRWGQAYYCYYQLRHSFFMGSLVRHNLEMMSRKHLWIRTLSSTAILETENIEELPKRINSLAKSGGSKKTKQKQETPLKERVNISEDVSIEQCIGHSKQLVKNIVFNSTITEN